MLLTEPDTRIDGPAEEVLRVIYAATLRLAGEGMKEQVADSFAMRHLVRVHSALADAGYVVRQIGADLIDQPLAVPVTGAGAGVPARDG